MNPGIWTVRHESEPLARSLHRHIGGTLHLAVAENRIAFAAAFAAHRQWIFIGTAGIAVRYLQGLPVDKRNDPGVVVVDEAARFAISLLGGHEGGANALAYRVAAVTGAIPVVTTATESLRPLVLGIGCRKNVSEEQIDAGIAGALRIAGQTRESIREVATIDLKASEPGLVAWCERHAIPLRIFGRETLVPRGWVTAPSDWVRENLGLDGVCEPCALIASPRGKLILPKTAHDGVAVAIVEDVPVP